MGLLTCLPKRLLTCLVITPFSITLYFNKSVLTSISSPSGSAENSPTLLLYNIGRAPVVPFATLAKSSAYCWGIIARLACLNPKDTKTWTLSHLHCLILKIYKRYNTGTKKWSASGFKFLCSNQFSNLHWW